MCNAKTSDHNYEYVDLSVYGRFYTVYIAQISVVLMPAKTFQLGKEYIIFLKRKHASLTIKVFDGRHPIIIRSAAIWLVCVFSVAFFCMQATILGLHNWRPAGWLPCKWPDFGSVSKKINTLSLPLWILLINFTFTFTYAASYFVHSYFFCL